MKCSFCKEVILIYQNVHGKMFNRNKTKSLEIVVAFIYLFCTLLPSNIFILIKKNTQLEAIFFSYPLYVIVSGTEYIM